MLFSKDFTMGIKFLWGVLKTKIVSNNNSKVCMKARIKQKFLQQGHFH